MKKKMGRPHKEAGERHVKISITIPPDLYRDARASGSLSGYIQELYRCAKRRKR